MLAKIGRLTKDKEFEKVFKTGRSFYTQLLGIKTIPNSLPHSRLGILVSNKVSKKAVLRNKIRRRIRETIRAEAEIIKPGFDFAIICLPEIANKEYGEIKEAINSCFKKLRLYK